MADIVLTTLNAKYIHAAFGLRYLLANLGPLQPRACLAEFDINQRPLDIAEALLVLDPKIIVYDEPTSGRPDCRPGLGARKVLPSMRRRSVEVCTTMPSCTGCEQAGSRRVLPPGPATSTTHMRQAPDTVSCLS